MMGALDKKPRFAIMLANCGLIYYMPIFKREIEQQIVELLWKKRAILVFGPRQAGKTTLARKILARYGNDGAYFDCDLVSVRKCLIPGRPELLKGMIGKKKIAVLDEAQTVQDIGLVLKVFVDTYPDVQLIATGSSSFDLANKINEPLTGRAFEFTLLPLSLPEIRTAVPGVDRARLDELIRLGTYPAIVAEQSAHVREKILRNLTTNYLFKDVYMFESIRNPRAFEDLLRALALQAGSIVSINELSQTLGVARLTVEKYMRLLEQSYVVRIVRSFSRNPRTEMKKGFKAFFLDTGIRNAVIDNFKAPGARDDRGALFENFFVAERIKHMQLGGRSLSLMFWRSRDGAEIDVIETEADTIRAFECKWNDGKGVRVPAQFRKAYPSALFSVVTPDTLLSEMV